MGVFRDTEELYRVMGALFSLLVLFVVEDNLHGEFTPLERHSRVTRLADRAAAYGMPAVSVDGNDAARIAEAMVAAVRAR